MWTSNLTPGYLSKKNMKAYVQTKTYTQMFIVVLFVVAPNWGSSKAYQQMSELTNCGVAIEYNTSRQ